MKMPTQKDYIRYYGGGAKVEVLACEYDAQGYILDFAVQAWRGRDLKNVPTNTPLQLNILNRDDDKIEDVLISITNDGQIVDGGFHFA